MWQDCSPDLPGMLVLVLQLLLMLNFIFCVKCGELDIVTKLFASVTELHQVSVFLGLCLLFGNGLGQEVLNLVQFGAKAAR